jgi:hypothetical protein
MALLFDLSTGDFIRIQVYWYFQCLAAFEHVSLALERSPEKDVR